MYELAGKRVFVTGHRGMVGGAVVRRLAAENCTVLTAPRDVLDLSDRSAVARWFADNRPPTCVRRGSAGGRHPR